MSKRPPNELESRLHQASLSAPKKELSIKQVESIIPDASARQNALNFLLAVGLLKSLSDSKGNLSFRAVTKSELTATKDLSGEENLVLGHIKASSTEGIWTKHLKSKTNLHQTIIDRCLKTLVSKRLIKRVPSVQHPTRKIYMLEGLDPSIALTGGPWYTDNELDTQFIQHLCDACLKFIRDMSFPKRKSQGSEGALYPISNSPQYPTAQHIRTSLKQARLTETDLTVEHVEMLLNVLILDGLVEKIPTFGSSMWDSNAIDDGESRSEVGRSKQKRKRVSGGDDGESKRKRKKRSSSDFDSDSDEASPRKKSKRKRTKGAADIDSDTDSEVPKRKKKKRSKRRSESEEESSSSGGEGTSSRKKKKSKKKKSRKAQSSSESETSSSEGSDHSKNKLSKSLKRSPSPFQSFDGGGSVYRAIKQERLSLGWSESPCAHCPTFEFCKDGGPVNPRECAYYGNWLVGGTVASIEDDL